MPWRPVAGDPKASCFEVAQNRGPRPSGSRVGGDTDGLIDDDDVLVVVQDRHIGDRGRLILRLRDRHLNNVEGAEAIRLPRSNAVNEDVPLPRQLRAARARQAEHAGQSGVHPLTYECVGDGKHTRAHCASSFEGSRESANASSGAPRTIQISATLPTNQVP